VRQETGKEQAVEVDCDEGVAIRSSPGKMERVVIRRRLGNAAAFASTGSYPTVAIPAAAAGYVAKEHGNSPYCNGLSARTLELRARPGFVEEMIFMANHLFKVAGLAALVVFPAHSQNLSALDHAVAITTYLQFITEDDVDQRTRLDLLLAQKQVSREDVISRLGIDMDNIAKAEGAGLLSDALVDKAFADMCSRLSMAPADLMKAL
jgi:hypothetical protein